MGIGGAKKIAKKGREFITVTQPSLTYHHPVTPRHLLRDLASAGKTWGGLSKAKSI